MILLGGEVWRTESLPRLSNVVLFGFESCVLVVAITMEPKKERHWEVQGMCAGTLTC